jgi:hypothetical protein
MPLALIVGAACAAGRGADHASLVEQNKALVRRHLDGRITEHGGVANLLGPLLEAGAVERVEPTAGP